MSQFFSLFLFSSESLQYRAFLCTPTRSVLMALILAVDAQLIRAGPSNQLRCFLCRTMLSRVLLAVACFHHLAAQPSAAARCLSRKGPKKGAHAERGLRTLLVASHIDRSKKHPLPDDARRGWCSRARFCQRSAVPCVVAILCLYAATQPLIKRRHMQLESTLTLQIKCLWVNAVRIWTSSGCQHARIGGRFYNACESFLLDFGT